MNMFESASYPDFEAASGVSVRVVAVGSGTALRMGREGNADALITHAPDPERALVAEGSALSRRPFMRNFFVLAGPPRIRSACEPRAPWSRPTVRCVRPAPPM